MSQNAPHMLRRSIIGILSAMLFIACGLVCMPSQAFATQSQTAASTGTQHRQVLSLSEATAVVTDTSGYHLKVTITNTDSRQWQAGRLSLNINSDYTFTSRTDMQEWAQSQNMIPAPNELGSVAVPALAPGQSTTVAINAKADNAALTSIMTWGPKPLLAVYAHDDENVELRSFLTRSSAGLAAAQTPAMQITMVAPLSSSHWQVSNEALTAMVNNPVVSNSGNGQTAADAASSGAYGKNDNAAVTLNSNHTRFDRSLSDVLSRHSALQVIADPTYLNALNMPPKVSALMQPAAFDITAYAADGNTQRYTNAGVQNSMWNAKASLAQYRNAIGDNNATIGTVAWQGKGHWTMDALTEARRHGYSAVISTADFEPSASDTVRTGTNVVTTDAGDITVLVEQRELSNLAQGSATSRKARAESSEAGRLARFVAQSAFYQMEQPYTQRNLLVNFGFNADAATLNSFMSAVESSPWLQATDLQTLCAATPLASGDDAQANVPRESDIGKDDAAFIDSAIAALSASRSDIIRFRDNIMKPDTTATHDRDNGGTSDDRGTWINRILNAQSTMALRAFTADDSDAALPNAMVSGAQQLSGIVMNSIALTPSEAVTMVSETATMPVTVRNSTPFPAQVTVSSITDSSEIATSRRTTITVPAHAETQTTFRLRAATSGSAIASIALEDRVGVRFGQMQQTSISCILKISDMTGFIIIAAAVVLGLLGLWRQFHRKKDPDE